MMSLAASGMTRAPLVKFASELNGDCDWPLPFDPLFFTYQTRLERLSVPVPVAGAAGLIAIENDCEPVQLVLVSVAVTVKVKVPVAVGVPLKTPFVARLIPGGGVPPL